MKIKKEVFKIDVREVYDIIDSVGMVIATLNDKKIAEKFAKGLNEEELILMKKN